MIPTEKLEEADVRCFLLEAGKLTRHRYAQNNHNHWVNTAAPCGQVGEVTPRNLSYKSQKELEHHSIKWEGKEPPAEVPVNQKEAEAVFKSKEDVRRWCH